MGLNIDERKAMNADKMTTSAPFSKSKLSGYLSFMNLIGREVRQYWNCVCSIDIQMEKVEAVRLKMRKKGERVTYTAFVAKAISEAVREHIANVPELNAALVCCPFRRIVYFRNIDLAIAAEATVNSQEIFFTSIIRDVDQMPLADIAFELATIRASAKNANDRVEKDLLVMRLPWPIRKIALWLGSNIPSLIRKYRGTLFLTGVGQYGVNLLPLGCRNLEFSMGPVERKAVVKNGTIEPCLILPLVAVFDHRTLAGAPVAKLLYRIRELLETEHED